MCIIYYICILYYIVCIHVYIYILYIYNIIYICIYLYTSSPVPFCAFNGNRDVWVDVGNKSYGIQALLECVFFFK